MIDGPDGSGKSTQHNLLAEYLRNSGRRIVCVREPGTTGVGEAIRSVLLDVRHRGMTVETELCLYMGARAQLIVEVIRPTLSGGRDILSDRFLGSTIVYQGIAGGLGAQRVLDLAGLTGCNLDADLYIVLDVTVEEAHRRRQGKPDRMEEKEAAFHAKVREGFSSLRDLLPNVVLVDGGRHQREVHAEIRRIVDDALQ